MIDINKIKVSSLEEKILKVADKLNKKHGHLSVKELYWASVSQLKYDSYKISQAIYQLITKNYIAKKVPLNKENILENDTRGKIYLYVSNFPGSSFKELLKHLKLPSEQLAFHIKMLLEFELIRASRFNNKIFYFNFEIDPKYQKFILALKSQYLYNTLDVILLNPKIDLINLASKANLSAKLLKDIIAKLLELDLISVIKEAKEQKYIGDIEKIEPIFKILKVPEVKIKKYKESQSKPAKKDDLIFLKKDKGSKKRRTTWQ